MTATKKICASIGVAVALAVFGCYLALPEVARGGNLALPAFLFPYAMFFGGENLWFLVLCAAQFPIYGAIFAWAWIKGWEVKVGWRLLALHLLLGIGCALIASADKLVR